ncbi:hypothetical protein SDC9_115375 [bioreactor metagenome]|uniref:Lipopolysaccharide export system permease protein LptG n=1 Tax=bioreactor metagenome TaxID=1076179 RepID=A0A645BT81_9ZZZZ
MWILNRYVTRDFLVVFCMAIGILTFGMMGARMVAVLEMLSRGVPVENFLKFVLYTLPIVLTYTIPWSILVATMVVFGRLSADSEITAMRACGISILQIIAPLLLIVMLMTVVCLYLQVDAGPPMQWKGRTLMRNTALTNPMALFVPGQQIAYEGTMIYIDDKVGNELRGLQMYSFDDKLNLRQDIFAERAVLSVDEEAMKLNAKLYKCIVGNYDGDSKQTIFNDELEFSFDYGAKLSQDHVGIRPKFLPADQLLAKMKIERKRGATKEELCELEVELNQRIAMALSPIAFLLLGLPLAIRTSRRETSVGLFLSVILGGVFFLSLIVCESITKFYFIYPQYLIWLPNLLFQGLGATMLFRVSQQ